MTGGTENTPPKEKVYSSAEIALKITRDLTHWRHENGFLRRTYTTHGWKSTLMVVNTIGHLAEAAWHHPDINVSYSSVEVLLVNHAAKGITDKDFELAAMIENVVLWQPGNEDGALEGTPVNDPRHGYVKYDD